MRGKVLFFLFGLVAVTFAPLAQAADPSTDRWEFKAAPYVWAVSLDGDMTVKGNTVAVDVNIIDIIEESDSIFAFEGYFEARKGDWGGFVDGTYADLSMGGSVGALSADVDLTYALVDFVAFYRVGTWSLSGASAGSGQDLSLEVLAGGRYTAMDVELDISTPGPSTVVDKRQDWVDPIVGGRVFLDLTDDLSLVFLGDVGGFGVGSDLSWNVAGLLFYDFDLFGRDASVIAGYRALYQDFEDGSGANKFAYDVTTQGPVLGMVIRC